MNEAGTIFFTSARRGGLLRRERKLLLGQERATSSRAFHEAKTKHEADFLVREASCPFVLTRQLPGVPVEAWGGVRGGTSAAPPDLIFARVLPP